MTCEEARLLVADEIGGARSGSGETEEHLAGCEACRAEAEVVRSMWRRMRELPDPEPRQWVATRFYAALDAYQQGMLEKRSVFWKWWPSQPGWQLALSLGCLAMGLFTGAMIGGRGGAASSQQMAELHKEMTGMRQMVTLSLLQQQSASERLRGVTWSYRTEPNDMEVLSALLRTATTDNNVDVRLAAVDSLRNFADSAVARRGLINALSKQDSPLVQVSIIDALVELREKTAAPALRTMAKSPELNASVQKRISEALRTFE
ncbi:MAG: HEAT repeat domain-containing protein [Bryobacteraceae bacterium]|nr:HEAT repeat domain-containing protein [Bryobacteraceae bacterium]